MYTYLKDRKAPTPKSRISGRITPQLLIHSIISSSLMSALTCSMRPPPTIPPTVPPTVAGSSPNRLVPIPIADASSAVCSPPRRNSCEKKESNSEIWGEWGATYGRNGLSGYLATRASRPRGRRSASARGTARGGHRGVDRRWSGCGARRRCERTAPHQTDTHRSPAPAAAAHAHCEETW